MKLLIIPGLSSPYCEQQQRVYFPLLTEAKKRLPEIETKLVLLPGQNDERGIAEGEFFIPDACERIRSVLDSGENYCLLARSSGCTVVAELLATWKEAPVNKVVFWGPPPFWLYHDMFASGEGPFYEKARKTGVQITKMILTNCTPWESNITKFSQRLLLATGAKDIFCPPAYIDYIVKTQAARIPSIEHAEVQDCPHGPTSDMPCWADYCQCVLGWLSEKIDVHTLID